MWTSVCLIILKATTVHQHPGGGPESKTESSLSVGSCFRRWYIVGSPFTVHRSRFVSSAIKVFGYGHIVFNYLGGVARCLCEGNATHCHHGMYRLCGSEKTSHLSFGIRSIFEVVCMWSRVAHRLLCAACSCMQCLTKQKQMAAFSRTIGKMRRTKRGCIRLWQKLLH